MHKLIVEYNCQIRTVILGEGITSRSNERDPNRWKEELKKLHSNILSAIKILVYDSLSTHSLLDNKFDTVLL